MTATTTNGNLVPFSAGVGYEENPTISYVPLSGEDFTRRMLSPVAADEWLLLGPQAKRPGQCWIVAVRVSTDCRNPRSLAIHPHRSFARLIELYDELRRADVIDMSYARPRGEANDYFWTMHDYSDAHGTACRSFSTCSASKRSSTDPISSCPFARRWAVPALQINIQTRSAFDVLNAFGDGIEIPAPHLEAGIVEPLQASR